MKGALEERKNTKKEELKALDLIDLQTELLTLSPRQD